MSDNVVPLMNFLRHRMHDFGATIAPIPCVMARDSHRDSRAIDLGHSNQSLRDAGGDSS